MMTFKLPMIACLCAVAVSPSAALASDKDWQTVSDVGAYSLMAFSIGLPIIKKDEHGAYQAAGSLVATSVITEGLKAAFPKTRPDGSDRKSFPSGHTSRSFSSAATIYNRYGASYGIPAFAVASLVGVARVQGTSISGSMWRRARQSARRRHCSSPINALRIRGRPSSPGAIPKAWA